METEITVQVFEKEENAINHLIEIGFEKLRQFDIIDNYFSKYSQSRLKKMSYKNVIKNSFLVREFAGGRDRVLLLYKNKVIKNDIVLMEEKVKTELDSKDNAIKILRLAGLNNWCELNQHITILRKGDLEIALQRVDNLGLFIEYEEDKSVADFETEEKMKIMIERLSGFGLKLGKDYACKKPFMILHKG